MRWSPEFNQVKSAANIADAVSRGDLSMARAQGWTLVRPPLKGILDVSPDAPTTYANEGAVDEFLVTTNFPPY